MMISALWANSNYDDDKGTRKNAIEEIERNFQEAAQLISGSVEIREREEDIDDDNPFFAKAKEGVEKLETPIRQDGKVSDVIQDYTKGIDQ